MRFLRGWALLVVLFIGPSVWAAEIARWEAGKGNQAGGVTLVNAAGSKWTLTQQHKFEVAAIEPTHDYYRRAEYIAKVSKPTGFPVWLVLEYLDEGYGLISVGPAGRRGCATYPGRISGAWRGSIRAGFGTLPFASTGLHPVLHQGLIPAGPSTSISTGLSTCTRFL